MSKSIYKIWADSIRVIDLFPPAYGGQITVDSMTDLFEIDSLNNRMTVGSLKTSVLIAKDSIVLAYKDTTVNSYVLEKITETTQKIDESELKTSLKGKHIVEDGDFNYKLEILSDTIAIIDGIYDKPDTTKWIMKKIDNSYFIAFDINEIGLLIVERTSENYIEMTNISKNQPWIIKKTASNSSHKI
ncbi:MAG: hypothetical protein JXQ87_17920 [Bacteroidia bacterium]